MFSLRSIAACAALLAPIALGIDTSKLKPTGYVNDFARALDPASARSLESYCAALERATGAQMAIVLVDSLEDDPIEDVANRLYREWGVGKKGKDEGILLLLAVRDHRQRAEVGYGLEPIVPDGFAGGVLRGIRPILRQGNYGGALLAAAQQIGSRIAQAKGVELGEPALIQVQRPVARTSIPWPLLLGGLFAVLWLIGRITGGRGGGGTGFLTGMILGNLMGRGGWGGGGFGGYDSRGGSGSGGGFGGFGGGDSGGGGASSDW